MPTTTSTSTTTSTTTTLPTTYKGEVQVKEIVPEVELAGVTFDYGR